MPVVTTVAVAVAAVSFIGLVANTIADVRQRRNARLLGSRVVDLESFKYTHISNERFISAMEKSPFVNAFKEAKAEYEIHQREREKELAARREYAKLTDIVVDRKLAARVIASIPYGYGRSEAGLGLSALVSEYRKYSAREYKEPNVEVVFLRLVTAGFLEKYNHEWSTRDYASSYTSVKKTTNHNEVRYKLTNYKKKIIEELNQSEPELREEMEAPHIETFVDIELAKKWVEEAQVEFLEEELAEF